MRSRQPAKRGEGGSPASWVGLMIQPKTKMNRCLAALPQQLGGSADTDDVETNPTLRGSERTNQRRTQLAALTGHEDRMRRQKKRETKRKMINTNPAKKNELSPPRQGKTETRILPALRPRTNNRRLWNLHQHETNRKLSMKTK